MTEQIYEIAKTIREKYSKEIEEIRGRKVRNVFFLATGLDGDDYYVFQCNNGLILAILKVCNFGMSYESHKWI